MRLKVAIPLFLAANLLAQPTQSDRYKYAPLVATAKLWNMIRYLHPQLTGDSTQWDAALREAIPKIEAAHSDDELAIALDAMLETLHDPCTRIAHGLGGKGLTVQSLDAETMVIHAGNGDLSGSVGAGLMIKMGIPQTSHVVWDLRGSRMPFSVSTRPDLRQLSQSGIGYAYREHSGYASQEGAGTRRYFSSLQMVDPQPVMAKAPSTNWRHVYLVDKESAVPMQAIIDQMVGRTAILSEDPPRDSQAGFTELVNVLGKVVAEVRVAEVRYADGTTGFAPTRVVLNRGDEAVKAAISSMNTGQWNIPGERTKFHVGLAGFRDVAYSAVYPSREMRILAAIRMWGVLRYFHPYTGLLGDKWDDVLVELLPRFSEAANAREYHQAAVEMAARTGDPSCTVKSSVTDEWFGPATAPVEVRFLEGQPVITRIFKPNAAQVGDVIVKINGEPVQTRIDSLSRMVPGPTPAARLSQVARYLLTAPIAASVKLTVKGKEDAVREVTIALNTTNQTTFPALRTGEAVRLLNEQTGYVDLERMEATAADGIFQKFSQTASIIFDLRGYPKNSVMSIASRLVEGGQGKVAELFRNVVGIGSGDSYVSLRETELKIPRNPLPRYKGKTVALVDDLSQGLGNDSAMCLKSANKTVLIGSAGFPSFASSVATLEIPGEIKVLFSGEIPRWPGGGTVFPEGLKADVEVRPTIAGLREKRDEVLEAALRYLQTSGVGGN